MSEIFKYNFSLICESSNIQRLVRGPGCIDHFHLGSSRTNFSKSNISPAPSPAAPPAFSEDVWTVDCANLLITALLSSVFTPKPREDFSTWEPHFPVDVDFRAFFWWFRALQDLKYLYYLCERAGKQIYKCNTIYSRKIKHELLIPRSLSLSTQNRDKLINPFNGHMQL